MTATTLRGIDADAQFAELLERHRGILLKVAVTYCRNPADREDVAQEIVTQLWRAFPKFDAARTFSTWMYRIALNVAISFVRSNSLRERHRVALDDTYDVEDPSATPAVEDERVRLLHAFVDRLDSLNRALLLLCLDDHSFGVAPQQRVIRVGQELPCRTAFSRRDRALRTGVSSGSCLHALSRRKENNEAFPYRDRRCRYLALSR